jgi:NAD-dependent dihydropyrimidine dehydrogenase PreA subunit
VFTVKGKTSTYKREYNNLDMFKNKYLLNDFINYSKQDSVALYNALLKAQKQFIDLHNVDINTIVSISSLALKIFRTNYLEIDIPILNSNNDKFIRNSYYGGATDYYHAHVENAFYYDVNSLYPTAMCNMMPYQIIKKHNNMNNVNLDDFFGFCLCEIYCPENIDNPMLPLKYKGKTIFPKGK